jgi:hypothetical protein
MVTATATRHHHFSPLDRCALNNRLISLLPVLFVVLVLAAEERVLAAPQAAVTVAPVGQCRLSAQVRSRLPALEAAPSCLPLPHIAMDDPDGRPQFRMP